MTVSSAQNKVSYAGDGSTTVFSVPFLFQANADITAILRDANGAETTWVEGTDYTLTGAGNPSGGTLTATTVPATGEKLTIKRVVPLTQGTDYPEGGQFPAQSHEDALDRGTMADQQLQEQIDRTVKLKSTSALSNIDFPEPGADKGFKWNAGGTALQLTAGDPDAVNPATQAAADAAASSESAAASSESAAASSESAAAASATAASSSESAAAASATAAASSESAAASSETNAATSKTDAEAAAGAVAYKWLFDSSVSMGDPGTGDVRLNNATLSAVTQIAISAKIADVGNPDVSAFIVTWDDSNHSPRGTIVIRLSGTPATFVIYSINGAITDNGTWLQIPVAHVAGNGSLTDTDKVFIHFIRSGDDGTGTGDLLAANNLSDVADVPTARTNLGLGTAAVENVGVADGEVPLMDAVGYPAADGSQITGITAGGLTSISNAAIAAATNLDVTGFLPGTYDNYEVWLSLGRPATDNVGIELETSSDGGSTFDTGASDYTWAIHQGDEGGTGSFAGAGDDSEMQLIGVDTNTGNAADENFNLKLSIFSPETAEFTLISWIYSRRKTSGAFARGVGGGERQSAADVDGVRLRWTAGDWAAQGKIQFLGIAQ